MASSIARAMHALRFLVVGGGLAGLSCAIALQNAGHCVTVFEQSDGSYRSPGVVRGPPHMMRILKHLGVPAEVIQSETIPVHGATYVDGCTLEFLQYIYFPEDMMKELGGGSFTCQHGQLYDWLLDLARAAGADIRFNARVASVDPAAPGVTLQDGEVAQGDVVVGADGWDSKVRTMVVGRPAPLGKQKRTAYSFGIPEERVRADPELVELFRDHRPVGEDSGVWRARETDNFCWMGDGVLLVGLYCPRGKMYFLHLACTPLTDVNAARRWDAIFPLDDMELDLVLKSFAPPLQRLVRLADGGKAISCLEYAQLETWMHTKGKVVILGDAGEPAPPYTPEGAAAALGDGLLLGALFARLSARAQAPVLLGAFEEMRRPRVRGLATEVAGLVEYFALPRGPRSQARDRALKAEQARSMRIARRSADVARRKSTAQLRPTGGGEGACQEGKGGEGKGREEGSDEGSDEEEMRTIWDKFIQTQRYDECDAASDWWAKWRGAPALRTSTEERAIAIEVARSVRVKVDRSGSV